MEPDGKNLRVIFWCAGLAIVMLGLSFASVPLYDWFCRVTGFGGQPQIVNSIPQREVLDEMVEVRFDASLAEDMPWEFSPPEERTVQVRLGETTQIFYEAYNPTDKVVSGQASFNVYPYSAGPYFSKIECFCFQLQTLQPGERVQMPVVFFVDGEMLDDDEARQVQAITLSYTFYVVEDE